MTRIESQHSEFTISRSRLSSALGVDRSAVYPVSLETESRRKACGLCECETPA